MRKEGGKPQYGLVRVQRDSLAEPQVFLVGGAIPGSVGRRDFLRIGAAVPAAAALAAFSAARGAAATAVIRAHAGAITSLLASSDGTVLTSGSGTEDMKKWVLPDGSLLGPFGDPPVRSVGIWALSPDGARLAHALSAPPSSLARQSTIQIYRFPEGLAGGEIPITEFSQPTAVAFAPDPKSLLITDGSEIVVATVNPTGQPQLTRRFQAGLGITCLTVDRSIIIAGSRDGVIRTWNLSSGAAVGRFNIGGAITAILLLVGQPTVATGHADGTINLLSLGDGTSVTVARLNSPIRALVPGPGGDSLVSGCEDGTIRHISLLTGDSLSTRNLELADGANLTMMAVIGGKNLIAVGTSTGQIVLLDFPDLQTRTYLFDPVASDQSAKGVAFRILDPTTGRTVTYTLPCGSQIPPGATCVCNCVPGAAPAPLNIQNQLPPNPPGPTMRLPCTPTPIPPGYRCTCNCIPGQ